MIPMRYALIRVVFLVFAQGMSICSVASDARELDEALNCQSDPHAFIAKMIDDGDIAPTPSHIEGNSVNAFRASGTGTLTAFGLPVKAVFGYQPDDGLFKRGSGTSVSAPIYGAVVFGSTDEIEARLRHEGNPAEVHAVVPLLITAIVCKTHTDRSQTQAVRIRAPQGAHDR